MNARALASLLLGTIAGGAIASAACSSSSSNPAPPAAGGDAGDDAILIGVSNSLTGGLEGIGAPLHNAWKVAEQYVNASGGVLGRKLRFIEVDDTSDESQVVKDTVLGLLGQHVVAMIGPNGSGQVTAVADVLAQNQIIELTATATSTTLSTLQPMHDRYLFRTVPADDLQGRAVVKLAESGPGTLVDGGAGACTKLALFYYSNAYGKPMADVITSKFSGQVVESVQVDPTLKSDYSTEANKILAATPDCLAMIVYDDVGDAFLRQLRQAAGGAPPFWIMGTDGVYTESFINNGRADPSDHTLPSVAEGVYGTNPDTNPPDKPSYGFFKDLYTAMYPLPTGQLDVDAYASNEFDSALLIALAIEQAGGTSDRVKVRDSLYAVSKVGKARGPAAFADAIADIHNGIDIDYDGASGPVDFDDQGNVIGGYIFWQVQGGELVTLKHVKPEELPQ